MMNQSNCVLDDPSRGGFLPVLDRKLEGIYLYCLGEVFNWIWSGKTVGSDQLSPMTGVVLRNEKVHAKKVISASLVDGE